MTHSWSHRSSGTRRLQRKIPTNANHFTQPYRKDTDDWLRTRKASLRKGSEKLHQGTIDRLISHFGANTPISKITPKAAELFIAEMKPERKEKQGGELSNWTRHKMLRNSKTIFESAVTWGDLRKNPFRKIKGPKLVTTPWYYVTPEEYGHLLDVAPTLQWKAAYALMYTGGLRFGEAYSLTWENIDFEAGEVTIEERAATAGIPPFHVKDHESRTIPLPRHTLEILTALQAESRFKSPFVLLDESRYKTVRRKWRTYQKEGRAWENQDMVNNSRREFQRHLKSAAIVPKGTLSIHTLRKCAGKNWADHLPPNVVKELMGHSNIATTMRFYNQVDEEQRAKAARVIDRLVGNRGETTDAKLTPAANTAS